MDTQTRIGIGAAALFGMTAFVEPLLGWYVAGPVMALCVGVATWGFWPLIGAISMRLPLPNQKIPLAEAARIAYENTADSPDGEMARHQRDGSPEQIIKYYCHVLFVRAPAVYGYHSPSRKPEKITTTILNRFPIKMENGVPVGCESYGGGRYEGFYITRRSLTQAITAIENLKASE